MDLTCYVFPQWEPRIRPAVSQRTWMGRTSDSYAYRCLPLSIANSHGWELLAPAAFDACWNGGPGPQDVDIRVDSMSAPEVAPVSLFGAGTLTCHIQGIFRTPPGWNLWVTGPPNEAKDGITALSGVIETDLAPLTFTMNWRFTRPHHWVHFDENEPIGFIFPVERAAIEQVVPRFAMIDSAPELRDQYLAWSKSREDLHTRMRHDAQITGRDSWQKFYYRGTDASGRKLIQDHRTKLKIAPFEAICPSAGMPVAESSVHEAKPSQSALSEQMAQQIASAQVCLTLQRREWLLETQEGQRSLSEISGGINRYENIDRQNFLDHFYAPGRPVVISGVLNDWPALRLWTPEYLKQKVGSSAVECQADRVADVDYETQKEAHRLVMPFDKFIDQVTGAGPENDLYITPFNSDSNLAALAPLQADLGHIDSYLTSDKPGSAGMMWIGGAGTFTPLHHDLTNNLIAQIRGRKSLVIAPPSETSKLYHDKHVFSHIRDLKDPALDLRAFPMAAEARVFEVTLEPGELLYLPIGWWHQVRSLEFSVSITFTNFIWPNEAFADFPKDL